MVNNLPANTGDAGSVPGWGRSPGEGNATHSSIPFVFFFLLIFFIIYIFNWRTITLQYCGFFAIHQHELATGIHVPFLLNSLPTSPIHPSRLSQSLGNPMDRGSWHATVHVVTKELDMT